MAYFSQQLINAITLGAIYGLIAIGYTMVYGIIGMINFAVPANKLEAAVTDLAERLMKKSPAVLRATKHAVRQVRTMDVPQAYDYLAAKGQAIKVSDKEDSYNTGLRQFLDEKSYKPTYEPFKLGTMLTDQRSAKK